MRLSKIVFEEDSSTLTLERIRDYRIKATWEGMRVNRGRGWHNSFCTHNVQDVQDASNEILMLYFGESQDDIGKANLSHDRLAIFERHLLELGRP